MKFVFAIFLAIQGSIERSSFMIGYYFTVGLGPMHSRLLQR